jgi:hypothetical protein
MSDTDKFSEEEARRRMQAALRGARIVGHMPMKAKAAKAKKAKPKRKKKPV